MDCWNRGEAPRELLKENSGRTIWRVSAGTPALYVKRFPRDFFRDRARKEAALLQALAAARVPSPRLVAVAKDDSATYVITEEISGTRTLATLLREGTPDARPLLQAFGRLARVLHDHGFEHLDFHSGNVLVRGNELYVIDVHRARICRTVPRRRRLEGVAFAAMSFSEVRPATDLIRFFRAYGLRDSSEWQDVWERLRRRREQYYRGRQERCLVESSGFGLQGRTVYRKGVSLPQLLETVRSGPRTVIKEKPGERVSRLGGDLFLKETSLRRARQTWVNSHGLAVRGIDTPKLWAWHGTWIAGEWFDSADLYGYVRGGYASLSREGRTGFLRRLARLVRRMHDRGVFHADLKAANVLVGSQRIVVVDLDRVRFSLEVPEGDRLLNLAQLNASVTPPITRSDRLRFLHAYFGNCSSLWKKRTRWVREIMKRTRARRHHWPSP